MVSAFLSLSRRVGDEWGSGLKLYVQLLAGLSAQLGGRMGFLAVTASCSVAGWPSSDACSRCITAALSHDSPRLLTHDTEVSRIAMWLKHHLTRARVTLLADLSVLSFWLAALRLSAAATCAECSRCVAAGAVCAPL